MVLKGGALCPAALRPTAGDEPPPYGPGSSMRVITTIRARRGGSHPVRQAASGSEGAGIPLAVRRLGRSGDLGAGAETGIGEPHLSQPSQRRLVALEPLRLAVRAARAAPVRPLVPVETEPAKLV